IHLYHEIDMFFFFQAEDGIRDRNVTGVQTCALPISVDLENMEGLPVSIETIHETYSGKPGEGGVAGTGDEDVPGYQAADTDEDGDYELVKETINNEFNRIRKEIAESPYKDRDLGIQVAVDRNVRGSGE